MRAKEFEIKKRDPNWKTMQDIRRSGAGGQHKDKKKAEKQGEVKHKGRMAEGDYPDGSSLKTPSPEEWQKEYEKAKMAVKKAKTQQEYEAASDRAGRIKDLLASKGIKVGPVLGKEGVSEDKAGWSDNSGTVKKYEPTKKGPMPSWRLNPDGTATDKNTGITYNRDGSVVKKEEESEMEGRRDYGYDSFGNSLRPGDDEGSTEPPNNFAIYINGKKWKVFQGKGQYADDQYEMQQFRQLQAMAARKSQETGKKWEVSRTLEPATK